MKIGMDKHGIAIIMPNWIGRKLSEFIQYYSENYKEWKYMDYMWNLESQYSPIDKYSYIVLIESNKGDQQEHDLIIKRQFCRLGGKTKELKCVKS